MSRLPITGTADGWPVMTVGAIHPGAVAHRPATTPIRDEYDRKRIVSHPACMPAEDGEPPRTRAPRFPEVSAGWADHQFGVVPCTAARCFPDAG